MKKIFYLLFFVFLFSVLPFLFNIVFAQEDSCETSDVTLVFRNSDGDFLPNISFAIYTQVLDADNNDKPGQQVASGKTSATLGKAEVHFTSKESNFVIKVWDKNQNIGAFYFYNDLQICGGETEVTEYLSSFKFSFRDTDLNLLKNTTFSVYTQGYDADDEPMKEKNDLVAQFNTGEQGLTTVYVSDSSRSIDGNENDNYVLELKAPDGGIYQKFNLNITDGNTNNIDYVFSDALINLRDENNIAFPAGEKIEVYQQDKDENNNAVLGDYIKYINTDDDGQAVLQYPASSYALKLIGEDKKELKFFNIDINENSRSVYNLSSSENWDPSLGSCDAQSSFVLKLKDLQNNALPDYKYELYEQDKDVNNHLIIAKKVLYGEVDDSGQATKVFNPDPRKKYVLKLYKYNQNVGAFWYFNEIQFVCGQDFPVEKQLSALRVVMRTADGNLAKNKKFSIYTQDFDVDGFPIKQKKDLISSSFTTSDKGVATVFLPGKNIYNQNQRGLFVLETFGENNKKYIEYDIEMNADQDTQLEYVYSDIVITLKDSNQQTLSNQGVSIYQREYDAQGNHILGKLEQTLASNEKGELLFSLPSGFYVLRVKDDLSNYADFWYLRVANRKRTHKTFYINTSKTSVYESESSKPLINQSLAVYSMKKNSVGKYERDEKIKTLSTGKTGYLNLKLASEPYLFVVSKDKKEYGEAVYTDSHKTQEIKIYLNSKNIISINQQFALTKPRGDIPLGERLAGKILLQVEGRGEAWYVDTKSHRRYYMKDGATAYEMMRKFGLGISNKDLSKIPIGLDNRMLEFDYDGDSLSDKTEEAIGTDMYDDDSDDDGYNDGEEIKNGFNPNGSGSLDLDQGLADKLRGHIVLQVEGRGEAWYISPETGKRYYMKDGASAYEIMRFLSLGISDENLEEIELGKLK